MRFQGNRRQWRTFALGVVTGLLVWFGSPLLFGTEEPWDATGIRYFAVILGLGVVFGVLTPEPFWIGPFGLYAGQFAYGMAAWLKSLFAYEGGGANFFIPLGAITLVWVTLPAFAGAFVAALSLRARSSTRRGA